MKLNGENDHVRPELVHFAIISTSVASNVMNLVLGLILNGIFKFAVDIPDYSLEGAADRYRKSQTGTPLHIPQFIYVLFVFIF